MAKLWFRSSSSDAQVLEDLGDQDQKTTAQIDNHSAGIVVKPWGYEYLAFESAWVAVWCLVVGPRQSTSLHCHRTKDTVLTVLKGRGIVKLLEEEVTIKAGDVLFLGKSTFHQTIASEDGLVLLEAESPVDKHDLLRIADHYGRRGSGYERVRNEQDEAFSSIFPRTGYIDVDNHESVDGQQISFVPIGVERRVTFKVIKHRDLIDVQNIVSVDDFLSGLSIYDRAQDQTADLNSSVVVYSIEP